MTDGRGRMEVQDGTWYIVLLPLVPRGYITVFGGLLKSGLAPGTEALNIFI
jgi:hypothetical protein